MKQPCVYILASRRKGTLYTGVTSDLVRRIWAHKHGVIKGFTKRYRVHRLVYYEFHCDMYHAIRREKQIKKWNRAWKIELIERTNPRWKDLWPSLVEGEGVDSRFCGNDKDELVDDHPASIRTPGNGGMDSRFCGNDKDEGID